MCPLYLFRGIDFPCILGRLQKERYLPETHVLVLLGLTFSFSFIQNSLYMLIKLLPVPHDADGDTGEGC